MAEIVVLPGNCVFVYCGGLLVHLNIRDCEFGWVEGVGDVGAVDIEVAGRAVLPDDRVAMNRGVLLVVVEYVGDREYLRVGMVGDVGHANVPVERALPKNVVLPDDGVFKDGRGHLVVSVTYNDQVWIGGEVDVGDVDVIVAVFGDELLPYYNGAVDVGGFLVVGRWEYGELIAGL